MGKQAKPIVIYSVLFSVGMTAACAPERRETEEISDECEISEQDAKTFSGRWPVLPVPISFHSGDFEDHEIDATLTAADTWNSHFKVSQGIQAIDYGSFEQPWSSDQQRPEDLCSESLIIDGEFKNSVVIYKSTQWNYDKEIMAMTSYCPVKVLGETFREFNMAVIELNYEYFFVEGKREPDLETIMLHEFGHLIGLNHSVELDQGVVMKPNFDFPDQIHGEKSRSLGSNDQARSKCLYADYS